MKKIATLTFVMSLLITPLSALEKMDCSEMKKLSKEHVNCKKGNFKAGLLNFGKKIKDGAKKIKLPQKGMKTDFLKNSTKQYPKGVKIN